MLRKLPPRLTLNPLLPPVRIRQVLSLAMVATLSISAMSIFLVCNFPSDLKVEESVPFVQAVCWSSVFGLASVELALIAARCRGIPLPDLTSTFLAAPDVAKGIVRRLCAGRAHEPASDWRRFHDPSATLLLAGLDEAFLRKPLLAARWRPDFLVFWVCYAGPVMAPLVALVLIPIIVGVYGSKLKVVLGVCVISWAIWAISTMSYLIENDFMIADLVQREQAGASAFIFFPMEWQSTDRKSVV